MLTQVMDDERFQELMAFTQKYGLDGTVVLCAKDMSNRQYYRFFNDDNQNYIIMDIPVIHLSTENPERFIALSDFLVKNNIAAPKVLGFDLQQGFILLEDFGDNTFSRLINAQILQESTRDGPAVDLELQLYETAISVLKKIQSIPKPFFIENYSVDKLLKEVEVFIDWYWLYVKGNKAPELIKKDYMSLWNTLFTAMPSTPEALVLRDFHCDNLMTIRAADPFKCDVDTCGVLDFQDALWGSVAYDFISLVEDARRTVSTAVIERCAALFFQGFTTEEVIAIQTTGKVLALGRHIKVLGVFARYAIKQKNASKCVHNPRLWRYCEQLLQDPLFEHLAKWFSIYFPTQSVRV